jgi:succinate-semialdehyde dehydrogenase/glutarate-semialdehyde dehydrogenase
MTSLPAPVAELPGTVPTELLIGGAWVPSGDGSTFAVEDPASASPLVDVADATVHDGLRALSAATEAFAAWRRTAPRARAELLGRAAAGLADRREELALVMTLEMGKPLAESRGEIAYAAAFLRWYAEEAVRIDGRTTRADDGGRLMTFREPVGPCVFVTPWNFPLAMGARKIAPALAAGCTCVVKPAAQTPLSMLLLGEIMLAAGLPPGVVNVVPTTRAEAVVAALLADPRTRKLSFTGSTAVGRALIAQAAEQVLRVSMELGGNAPFVVFGDADLERAVDGALIAKMRNGGEACTSANRFLVHESVVADFTHRLTERVAALRVGRGIEDGTQVGPLIDARQLARVEGLVEDAVARGAQVRCGGAALRRPGHFLAPTVLDHVPPDAALLAEEIFGPVAPVVPFADDAEAVALANDTPYGLVAYVYTRDLERAFAVTDALQTGMVGLNQGVVSNAGAPFGGVGHSGFGREGGPEGLDEYLQTKYLAMAGGPSPAVGESSTGWPAALGTSTVARAFRPG